MNPTINLFNFVVLIPLGIALLWAVQLAYSRRRNPGDETLCQSITIGASIMIVMGLFGLVSSAAGPLVLPMLLVLPVILIMAVRRFRASEQQMLLWIVTVAAEKNIPLGQAIRSYADERQDEMGLRAAKLADLTEAGMPLHEAFRRSKHRLAINAEMAIRSGTENGTLGPSLRAVVQDNKNIENTLRSIFEKFVYLFFIAMVAVSLLTFIMIAIIPTFREMFDDFGQQLPAMTELLCSVSDRIVQYWPLVFLLLLPLWISLAVGTLHYMGLLPRDLPILNRFTLRQDGAAIMRSLAQTVRQNKPIHESIEQMARNHPKWSVALRLRRATKAIDQGAPWCKSLQRAGLIRAADTAVLQSAQRVGNLSWALEEMADSTMRRMIYRLQASINILFPIFLLGFGLIVFLIFAGLFLPLVEMIQGLA